MGCFRDGLPEAGASRLPMSDVNDDAKGRIPSRRVLTGLAASGAVERERHGSSRRPWFQVRVEVCGGGNLFAAGIRLAAGNAPGLAECARTDDAGNASFVPIGMGVPAAGSTRGIGRSGRGQACRCGGGSRPAWMMRPVDRGAARCARQRCGHDQRSAAAFASAATRPLIFAIAHSPPWRRRC